MFSRSLQLPPPGDETFFLWGPRQAGKSTLLKSSYSKKYWIDLLMSDRFRQYATRPETLRERFADTPRGAQIVIDEVQKVPALLDEVHWLHENRGLRFALCGSSARKVRRGGANLLGGRAIRYELHGLTASELGEDLDLDRLLSHGFLPSMYVSPRPERLWRSYVADYLKEEIAAEGLVRSLPVFSDFLDAAAFSDGAQVNFSNIARECAVSSHTARSYFEILVDSLLGHWLPAYRRRPKRRIATSPKFYFADVGIVNHLARRGSPQRGSEAYGRAFESWVFHELLANRAYLESDTRLHFWRLTNGAEVDFILDDMRVAIEVKASARIASHHLKGLRQLAVDHPQVGQRLLVCLETEPRRTRDGILILPAERFALDLAAGRWLVDA